ncbi:hypothetical protein [Streptomyces purpureus]|uniref:LigA protein n=2 Tax=Streptomyces purpureus TaxID=1951 RepID=A0A918H063_9ACTN|nr:hypothetical protein [Streptomyces purpureus]GGT24538.1 hypothetical protein GCM10014713_17080 [Streptomyces purpureus]
MTPPLSPARRALRAITVAACLPYVSLKIAWIAGSRIGIPDGSVLLEHRTVMAVANGVTVLMDAAVVVLALLLTQAWGLRVRAWLPAVPMWGATGLLSPIVVAYPAQLVLAAFMGAPRRVADGRPFLEDWVFGVVYGGFIVQALALGALFVTYARDRWGHVARGRVGELPRSLSGAGTRATAVVASLLALVPVALHTLWAFGVEGGLTPARIAERTSDFALLEGMRVAFAAVAVAGTLMLVFRLGRSLRVRTPLALAWLGSAALGSWGAYLLTAALLPVDDPGKRVTGWMLTAYAGEMITGLLMAGCLAVVLRRRGA